MMSFFLIALIAVLLLPKMASAWKQSRTRVSINNLHQIGILVADYQNNNGGRGARRSDGGHWRSNPDPMSYYWGAMYEIDKKAFRSPHTWSTSTYQVDGPRSEGHIYTDYGFNGVAAFWSDEVAHFEVQGTGLARELSTYNNPATTILAQDHYEAMIDGDGDVPCYAFTEDQNSLLDGHKNFNPGAPARENSETMLFEIFRNQDMCCVLWADGHVSKIAKAGVWDPRWYTGGFQGAQEVWEKRENGRFVKPPPYSYGVALTTRL
ncbi:MAG: hypothetical protein EXS22_08570 [Pedosphaera sp.]|nr:hypothetical protein [Pedosphaera sp.]